MRLIKLTEQPVNVALNKAETLYMNSVSAEG